MPLYRYTGISYQGERVTGTADAPNQSEALLRARETCEVILSLQRSLFARREAWDSVEEDEKRGFFDIELGAPRLDLKTFSVTCNQFSIILRSGMPVAQTVRMVADTIPDKMIQRWLRKVLRDVENGQPLADSMAARGKAFLPTTFIETVRAGEASGNLDRSFASMARHFESQYKMRAQIRGAMTYPIVILVVAVLVMAVIMVYVIPMFTAIFEAAGSQMPPLTRMVIDISNFFKRYWWIFPLLGVGGTVAYKAFDTFPKIHTLYAKIRLRLPVFGKISLLSASCQFTETLGTLMDAGLTMVNAVQISANVIGNAYISGRCAELVEALEAGASLGDAMRRQNVFPKTLIEMVAMGEQSGEMVQTLEYVGDYYDGELHAATEAAVKTLGPAVLVVVGGFSIFLVAGVYTGMFGMYGAMTSAMTA